MLPAPLPWWESRGGDDVEHEFLSPEWIAAVKDLRNEFPDAGSSVPAIVRMNLLVNETPSGGEIEAHVDTSGGVLLVDVGHLVDPDLHVTVDFITARALLVEGNPQAAMSAFMAGKIRIEGDMAKLMALQGASPDPSALEFADRVRALTI